VGERLGQDLVSDGLWEIVEPLIPPQTECPQGGGTRYVDDRAVVDAASVRANPRGSAGRGNPVLTFRRAGYEA